MEIRIRNEKGVRNQRSFKSSANMLMAFHFPDLMAVETTSCFEAGNSVVSLVVPFVSDAFVNHRIHGFIGSTKTSSATPAR